MMKERRKEIFNERMKEKKVKFIPHVAMHFKSRIDNGCVSVVVIAAVVVVVVKVSLSMSVPVLFSISSKTL